MEQKNKHTKLFDVKCYISEKYRKHKSDLDFMSVFSIWGEIISLSFFEVKGIPYYEIFTKTMTVIGV